MPLTLILGGVRSGKSRWAEELAGRCGLPILYVATASPHDPVSGDTDTEMQDRIRRHRSRRPPDWITLEEPSDVVGAVDGWCRRHGPPAAVLIDCLTLLLSNWLLAGEAAEDPQHAVDGLLPRIEATAERLAALPCPVFVVSNEVGWGIVPERPLARAFRDLAGLANQIFAARAQQVYVVWAGLPVEVSALTARSHGAP